MSTLHIVTGVWPDMTEHGWPADDWVWLRSGDRLSVQLMNAARGLLGRQHVQLALASMEDDIHLARQLYMDAATEFDHAALGGAMSHPVVRVLGHVSASVRGRAPVRGWLGSDRARDATIALFHRTTSERAMTRSLALSSMAKARGGEVAMRVTGAALELAGLRAGPVTT